MRKQSFIFILVVCACVTLPVRADLFTYSFRNITNDGAENVASQLSVEVTNNDGLSELGGLVLADNQVAFIFRNTDLGTDATPFITGVYFDDGLMLEIDNPGLYGPSSVSFVKGGSPSDLPGGGDLEPDFETTVNFYVTANNPAPGNGVHEGEYLGVVFNLKEGQTFDGIIAAIAEGFNDPSTGTSGDLRIGLHVQGLLDSNGIATSDSFVMVPLPATILLGFIGLGVGGWKLRKSL